MAAPNYPVADDEPESAPEEVAVPVLPPARPVGASPVAAYPVVALPLPPVRPGVRPSLPPQAAQSAPAAPEPKSEPAPAATRSGSWPFFLPKASDESEIELTPNMRIASLPLVSQPSTTAEIEAEEARTPEPTLVEKQTEYVNIACLQPGVMRLMQAAGEHFGGTPVITSGQRDRGRRGSYHRRCMAADFFIPGVERATLARFLRALPEAGGVGTYCHTKSVHIDTGDPRNWYQCGRRFRFAQR